jgi:hypothetical protein
MSKRLNDYDKDIIEKNFLKEDVQIPECDVNSKIVMSNTDKPDYQWIEFYNMTETKDFPTEFNYHSPTHYMKRYTMMNGKRYYVPKEIVQHLTGQCPYNPNSCMIPNYGPVRCEITGGIKPGIVSYSPKYQCVSVSGP